MPIQKMEMDEITQWGGKLTREDLKKYFSEIPRKTLEEWALHMSDEVERLSAMLTKNG